MKKIIITVVALTLGVCAFAKTLDTLVAEMPKGTKTRVDLDARSAYVEANKDDFVRELKSYSASELATKKQSELTDNEMQIRNTLAPAYFAYGSEIGVANIVGIRINTTLFLMLNGIEAYEKIKEGAWIVDGVKLTNAEKRAMAFWANDFDVVCEIGVGGMSKNALVSNVKKIKKLLLNAKDQAKAKAFCRAYQGAMLSRGVSDSSEEYKTMKAIEDYLNRGILFK